MVSSTDSTEKQGGAKPRHDANPYVPPARSFDRIVQAHASTQPVCELVSRGWLYRAWSLQAPIEAVIEYSSYGLFDRIWVNRRLVFNRLKIVWLSERLACRIPTTLGEMEIVLTLDFTRLARIRHARLTVGEQEVYREGA